MNIPKNRRKQILILLYCCAAGVILFALAAFFVAAREQTDRINAAENVSSAALSAHNAGRIERAAAWDNGNAGSPPQKAKKKRHRSLWDKLFGPFEYEDQPRQPPNTREQRPQNAQTPPTQTAAEKTVIVSKNANARRILVAGDFLAASLAEGLNSAYADNPDILIRSKIVANSGLNRLDIYAWTTALPAVIAAEKPDMLFVMIGANDRQPLALAGSGGKRTDFGTSAWQQGYQSRIAALTQLLHNYGRLWFWVGLPPFKEDSFSAAAADFNRFYKQATEQAGGHFIDIWEGFVDLQGNFSFSGYDMRGQTARLRANDGINFTFAGKRKLAFYAEQIIEPLLGALLAPPEEFDKNTTPQSSYIAPVNPMNIGVTDKPYLAGAPRAALPASDSAAAAPQKQTEQSPAAGTAASPIFPPSAAMQAKSNEQAKPKAPSQNTENTENAAAADNSDKTEDNDSSNQPKIYRGRADDFTWPATP